MPTVDLSDAEWGKLMNILATTKKHPWVDTNPLLMKIGQQLQQQAHLQPGVAANVPAGIKLDANGKEVGHESNR